MSGVGLSFQAMFAAPNTSKSCIWHSSIAIWNYSGSGRFGSGRLGSARSNSDYNAISASQQSWSFGLAELGNNNLTPWPPYFIQIGLKMSQIQTIPGWFRLQIKKFIVHSDTKANSAKLSWGFG